MYVVLGDYVPFLFVLFRKEEKLNPGNLLFLSPLVNQVIFIIIFPNYNLGLALMDMYTNAGYQDTCSPLQVRGIHILYHKYLGCIELMIIFYYIPINDLYTIQANEYSQPD